MKRKTTRSLALTRETLRDVTGGWQTHPTPIRPTEESCDTTEKPTSFPGQVK